MESNDLYLSWLLAAMGVFIAFIAFYYASEAKRTIERRLNEFLSSTISKIEKEANELNNKVSKTNDKVTNVAVSMNEQMKKLRQRDEDLREEIINTQKQLSDLRADLKNLDNRILPKYKR